MRKILSIFLILLITIPLFAQDKPPTVTNPAKLGRWVRTATHDLENKTLVAPTITGPTFSGTTTFSGPINVGEDDTGYDVKLFGATASNYVLWDESEDLFSIVQTNANTTGTERAATVTLTQTGAGIISEAFYAKVIADVQTGSWVNGIVGRVDYSTGSTGDAGGGMAAAICAELNLPARTPSGGTYTCMDLELEAPANYTAITNPTSFPVSFMRMGLWGNATATDSWQDYGYIFHIADVDDATGNVFFDNTIRCLVNTTAWYIAMSDAEGEYSSAYKIDISNTTNSTSTTTGSIQTDGGIGAAKAVVAGTGLTVGYTTADENEPQLKIIADADSDPAGDTDETLTIGIVANATPGNATWAFTNTQAAGYTFDDAVDVDGAFTAGSVASDAGVGGTTGSFTGNLTVSNTSALDVIFDNTTTGSDADSPELYFRGNDGAADTELDMSIFLDITTTTDYKLSFQNDGAVAEVASLDESGNLQIDGDFDCDGAADFGDNAITNVGNLSCDDILADAAIATQEAGSLQDYHSGIVKSVITFSYATDSLELTQGTGRDYGGYKILTFPEGAVYILGCVVNLTDSTNIAANATVDMGLGYTAVNDDADFDDAGEDDIIADATQTFGSSVNNQHQQSTATEQIIIDGTSAAEDVYINCIDGDDEANNKIWFSGTVTIYWVNMGDY